jgi:hypothetical protein
MTPELLDRIDPARYDVDAIVARLNEWDTIPEEEQEEHEDITVYSGIDEATHPLTALIGEAHNAFYAVRGLDVRVRGIHPPRRVAVGGRTSV